MNSTKATVFVIDDDEAVRASLRFLIESDVHVVETFASAHAFLNRPLVDGVGCIIADVRMPGMSGLELQEALNALGVTLPLIIITGHGDVEMAVRAMKSGAFDFVEKPFDDRELLVVVDNAIRENSTAHADRAHRREARTLIRQLSTRERQVLDLIVAGTPNKRVAIELGISEKTVEAHRSNIMNKMRAASFAELVTKVVSSGLKPF
jgi:FixJ family two-component response regulator